MIFLFAYLVIYVVAPPLSVYSMIGLLVVAVAAESGCGCGEWGGEAEFYPFETEPVQCPLTSDEPPAIPQERRL
jgi:hypothetical protein